MSKRKKSLEELLEEALVPEEEQPYEIPENWVWVELKSIAESIQYGYTESTSLEKIGPKFLRITDIQDNHVEWDNVPYCAINQSDYEKYKLEKNDILIARTGATTGKSYRIEEEVNAVFASYLIRVRLNELADASYVDYFMKSSVYWNQIMVSKKGIAQPGANSKILGALKIPLPNIWEQKRIAEKIKFLFSKIDKAKQLIEEAKESFELRWESILNKAFTGELTHKWRKENPAENVDDLVQQLKSIYSRSEFNEVLTNETLPEIWKCFRMADVIEINPTKDKLENINDEKEVSFVPMAAVSDELGIINAMESREYKRVKKGYTYFRENDILFAKITPCMENGKCAIAKNLINRFGFGSTEFYVLRASEFINPYYVYYFLRSKKFRAKAQAAMTGAVGQQRVPKIFLKDYPFPLPPKREQDKIVEILNSLKKYEFKIQEMINILEDLNLLKQSILSMAFKGELGTNAPTDEPAIELLKSILQEQL